MFYKKPAVPSPDDFETAYEWALKNIPNPETTRDVAIAIEQLIRDSKFTVVVATYARACLQFFTDPEFLEVKNQCNKAELKYLLHAHVTERPFRGNIEANSYLMYHRALEARRAARNAARTYYTVDPERPVAATADDDAKSSSGLPTLAKDGSSGKQMIATNTPPPASKGSSGKLPTPSLITAAPRLPGSSEKLKIVTNDPVEDVVYYVDANFTNEAEVNAHYTSGSKESVWGLRALHAFTHVNFAPYRTNTIVKHAVATRHAKQPFQSDTEIKLFIENDPLLKSLSPSPTSRRSSAVMMLGGVKPPSKGNFREMQISPALSPDMPAEVVAFVEVNEDLGALQIDRPHAPLPSSTPPSRATTPKTS